MIRAAPLLSCWIMKNLLTISFYIILAVPFGCSPIANQKKETEKAGSGCHSPVSGNIIYSIADSLINETETENIRNLSEIDTGQIFTTEDYFTSAATKNRLVLVDGTAGMSAGSADNLLILFACTDPISIIWAGQVGDFAQAGIRDLNNDGIKEIISTPTRCGWASALKVLPSSILRMEAATSFIRLNRLRYWVVAMTT